MLDTFISYQRKPSFALAVLLQRELKNTYGIDAYLDLTRLDSNKTKFPEQLMQAIGDSSTFTCLLSETTLQSEWVLEEIRQAFRLQKRCIPVFHGDFESPANPEDAVDYLLKFQGVRIYDDFVDAGIERIASLIQGKKRSSRLWMALAAVAALLIVLGISGYTLSQNNVPDDTVGTGSTAEVIQTESNTSTHTATPENDEQILETLSLSKTPDTTETTGEVEPHDAEVAMTGGSPLALFYGTHNGANTGLWARVVLDFSPGEVVFESCGNPGGCVLFDTSADGVAPPYNAGVYYWYVGTIVPSTAYTVRFRASDVGGWQASVTCYTNSTATECSPIPHLTDDPPITQAADVHTDTPAPDAPLPLGFAFVTRNTDWTPITQEFDDIEMVLVPAGCFQMGNDPDGYSYDFTGDWTQGITDGGEQCFEEPFWIDRYEVTNDQFEQFGGEAALNSHWILPRHPRENLTWLEARDFCEGRAARLPTEAEWEYAARGPSGFFYTWGNELIADNAVWDRSILQGTAEVGTVPTGISWVGAYDLSGNVWEWTSTIQRRYPYSNDSSTQNDENTTNDRALRGGSWSIINPLILRTTSRYRMSPDSWSTSVGFRCARDYDNP